MAITTTALLGTAGIIAAGQAPRGVSISDQTRAQRIRPLESGALGEQARIQSLIQLGAPSGTIVEDFIVNRLGAADAPISGRSGLAHLGRIHVALANGDIAAAEREVRGLNLQGQIGSQGFAGTPFTAKIVNGELELKLVGTEGEQINQLIGQTQQIFQDRLTNIQQTARAGAEAPLTREDILGREQDQIEFLLQALNEDTTRQQDIQTERLNRLGVSPAGVTSELERVRGLLANDIRTTGGIERALALEGGIGNLRQQGILSAQQALSPTLFDPALAGLSASLGSQSTGFTTAAQLATASAEAEAARNAGIVGGIDNLGASLLSSFELSQGLGVPERTRSGGGF